MITSSIIISNLNLVTWSHRAGHGRRCLRQTRAPGESWSVNTSHRSEPSKGRMVHLGPVFLRSGEDADDKDGCVIITRRHICRGNKMGRCEQGHWFSRHGDRNDARKWNHLIWNCNNAVMTTLSVHHGSRLMAHSWSVGHFSDCWWSSAKWRRSYDPSAVDSDEFTPVSSFY